MELVTGSSDANLINKWDTNLKACQQSRQNFEKQWHENLSFYYGRQWITTSKSGANGYVMTEQPPMNKWRVRHTANRILRVIRTEVTKLSKEEPQFYCQPSSTEEKDRLAAMAGDAIAEYILRTKYFNRKRLEATFWACMCGTSYVKNFFDPAKLELDGKPGKIDFEAVTAFHLFVPNLQVTDIQEQPYVIHARTMSPEDVWMSYGVELTPGTDSTALIIDSRFLTSVGIKSAKATETKQCYIKEVYVKPCKDYPMGMMFVYGENKVLYVYEPQQPSIGDETISDPSIPTLFDEPFDSAAPPLSTNQQPPVGSSAPQESLEPPKSIHDGGQEYSFEFPYRHGRYPFAKIDHIPTGMFYAESVIKSLIPLQKEYNRTRSIMLENRNLAGKPQWFYTVGSFDPRKFNSQPGLLLPVNMGFEPPQPLAQPGLPESIPAELQTILSDMDDAANQTAIAKGQAPPGIEAASAIAYLSEENDTTLFHTVQSLENAVQETGIQVLANVHDYWDEDRIVQMTSKNQFMEVRQFKATDLNPLMDFRVEPNSMAPRSIAAKQAFITELMKMGAIEPTKALRYLQMNETNKLYDEMMLDVRHAQRENVFMSQGQQLTKVDPNGQPPVDEMTGMPQIDEMGMPVPALKQDVIRDPITGEPKIDEMTGQPQTYNITVNPYDAHEVHVEEHQGFQKTQEYELLPPEIQQIIQDHVDEHKMEILKERNAVQADATAKQQVPEEDTAPPRELETASPNGQMPGGY